jgi:hypothetical protein
VTITPPHGARTLRRSCGRFAAISGYTLEIAFTEARRDKTGKPILWRGRGGESLKSTLPTLQSSRRWRATLYKTSLKEAPLLSFISPGGTAPSDDNDQLAQQIGWPLSINPQPNQGAILDAARRLIQERAWQLLKGPSIFLDRGEVAVTLAVAPPPEASAALQADFDAITGFVLSISLTNQRRLRLFNQP